MKIHNRVKRNLRLSAHLKHTRRDKGSYGPKTFKSEEKAIDYAKRMGIENYELVNLKSENSKVKKIKIVKK